MPRTTKIPVVVAYKKSKRKNGKIFVEKFENIIVDDIINGRKRKPLIPENAEIIEIGMGEKFEEKYKEKYKV